MSPPPSMTPPPGCPMHQPSEPEPKKPEVSPPPSCPMHQPETPKSAPPPPSCPMHQPGDSGNGAPVTDKLNELNMMPSQLSQNRQEDQTVDLPTERVISTIPKADASSKWEYPSPQQFYNALRRKGWETPEEEIETMVDIHNFLNEEAWQEVIKWEEMRGACPCDEDPYLVRLQGRPRDLSPKAWWHSLWGAPRPFDRHDWYVGRCGEQRRYVIDYYEGAEDVPGVPVFFLDVRPALDDPTSIFCRMKAAASEKWAEWFPGKPSPDSSA
ncbi:cytochrome c/c1 heme-lyase [Zychaea mexicana]|uniref:cytochrome c/c1 heme-lyase n=1 Tax=Zychaea mexicana TaxID=64656 RepID=UPI0022FEF1E6|nr:cytochrome c/c1 heme-lyase [Zychaea mexicana]KAI9490661.1 cytochrome c/c1 heme-lyase [Zychaea mexicana]